MRTLLSLILALAALTGCATTNPRVTGEKTTQERLGSAVVSPLSDLNIVQVAIPPIIQDALKNPYQLPAELSCKKLIEQIHELDIVLGNDLDVVLIANEKNAAERGQEFIRDEAIGSIERTINGVVPFRGWIRRLSGAERRSRELANAITAGYVRRAFLKGLGHELHCTHPASPLIPLPGVEVPGSTASIEAKNSNQPILIDAAVHNPPAPPPSLNDATKLPK